MVNLHRDQPSSLHEERILIDSSKAGCLFVHPAEFEDVVESVQGNLDDPVVHRLKEAAQGFGTALGDEVPDLGGLQKAARRSAGDRWVRFCIGLEVGALKDIDHRWDDVGVDDCLDLVRRSGGGSTGFLSDALGEKRRESRIDDLGLKFITGDDIADGS